MTIRITCINKDNGYHSNPHEGITYFGWIEPDTNKTGKATRAEMVIFLDTDRGVAYVLNGSNIAYCYTRQGYNGRFVQTYADNTPTDNLLRLPECIQ